MTAKPMKTLEVHHAMIQFLIKISYAEYIRFIAKLHTMQLSFPLYIKLHQEKTTTSLGFS